MSLFRRILSGLFTVNQPVIHLASPIDRITVYKARYADKFHTTPAGAFANSKGEQVGRYAAFRAGGHWFGFRGHFEHIEVVEDEPA